MQSLGLEVGDPAVESASLSWTIVMPGSLTLREFRHPSPDISRKPPHLHESEFRLISGQKKPPGSFLPGGVALSLLWVSSGIIFRLICIVSNGGLLPTSKDAGGEKAWDIGRHVCWKLKLVVTGAFGGQVFKK